MNVIVTGIILFTLFFLYKKTYVLDSMPKLIQYILLISLWSLSMYNIVLANEILKVASLTFYAYLYFILGVLLFFSGIKIMLLK